MVNKRVGQESRGAAARLRPLRSWKPNSAVKQLDTLISTLSAVDDPFFTQTHAVASTSPLLPLLGGCTANQTILYEGT
jgi:hypothetical protein